MSTITIRRSDVTTQEVGDALHDGLGARHHVLSGRAIKASSVTAPGRINPARSWLAPATTGCSAPRWRSPGTPGRRSSM